MASSSDLIVIVDEHANLRYANPAGARMLGLDPHDNIGHSMLQLIHPDDLEAAAAAFQRDTSGPGIYPSAAYRFRTSENEWRTLELTATNFCSTTRRSMASSSTPATITGQVRLERAQRTLAVIQLVVHSADEPTLLDNVCEMIVEVGNYRLAWVGYVEQDEAARSGRWRCRGRPDAPEVPLSWADDESGQGPSGAAVRERRIQVVNDLQRSRSFTRVAGAHAESLRSCCALPLIVADEVIGVIGMYASEPDEFDSPEIALMEELATELAFGIERLRNAASLPHHGRGPLPDACRERRPDGILETPYTGGVDYANPRIAEICGRDVEEFLGAGWQDGAPGSRTTPPSHEQRDLRTARGHQLRIRRPDGEIRHVRMSAAPKGLDGDEGYVTTVEDITEEVDAQLELTHLAFHDTLTGLPNRATVLNRLKLELGGHRVGRKKYAVLFLDLDQFKIVNDSLGHETGTRS